MIIIGTTSITSTKESHRFFCPQCGQRVAGRRLVVRRFLTLYFIPVIPLDMLHEGLRCDHCLGSYTMQVLDYDPGRHTEQFAQDLMRILILVMIADGHAREEEMECIQRAYANIAGVELAGSQIEQEIELAKRSGVMAIEYARRVAHTLTEEQKAMIVKWAFLVATAAGQLQDAHSQQLQQLGEALDIPDDRFRQYIQEAISS
jgi:uncharacterized tellurite resistance protein B-like protein